MKVLRVVVQELRAGEMVLDSAASRYVARVHRLKVGDRFLAIAPKCAREAWATITELSRAGVTCAVEDVSVACAASVATWALMGVCREDRFGWAIREATALGATHVVPVRLARCESVRASAGANRQQRRHRLLEQGARQSHRGDLPELFEEMTLDQCFEKLPSDVTRVCLWQGASRSLVSCCQQGAGGIAIMVGPEGGFEPDEIERIADRGFALASLGPWILRAETALIAALGVWSSMQLDQAPRGKTIAQR